MEACLNRKGGAGEGASCGDTVTEGSPETLIGPLLPGPQSVGASEASVTSRTLMRLELVSERWCTCVSYLKEQTRGHLKAKRGYNDVQ